ncbi:hypothetical protein SAMN05216223_11856 [Actinacidiphila yanglinensis]|uniref:DUF8129 domain-containing protein n=1 Tax=Actinacidiphila yanglinensis TaxID=310779 RepID=A0A1H6DPQ7_9ACTN|nr:hypothetical protein [Actinacidiphila yanglinensis]SEG87201.1 hypothetical protein SAMN05216223_11856 [Actinacidiphila yanglinensis]
MDEWEDEPGLPAPRDLPVAGYEHLPQVAIEARVASLDRDQVEALLRYETEHSGRTPVLRLLTRRLRDLRAPAATEHASGGYGPPPRRTIPGAGAP